MASANVSCCACSWRPPGTKGNTAERLVELLERRLDNVVFRAGFARTIPAARQLIMHGHVQVEHKKVDIPSFRIKQGQAVSIRERSRQLSSITSSLATPLSFPTDWLSVDPEQLKQLSLRCQT